MNTEKTTPEKRKKPTFLRRDWYKKIKFGKGLRKNQKYRSPKGIQNKSRLCRKGYSKKAKIGYSENKLLRGKVNKMDVTVVSNEKDLENIKSGNAILISRVGKKKRNLLLDKARQNDLIVTNKYAFEEKK